MKAILLLLSGMDFRFRSWCFRFFSLVESVIDDVVNATGGIVRMAIFRYCVDGTWWVE